MKLFGVDTAIKWINIEIDDQCYSVHFKDSFIKGIHEISIYQGEAGSSFMEEIKNAKIKSRYPSVWQRVREVLLLIKIRIVSRINLQK